MKTAALKTKKAPQPAHEKTTARRLPLDVLREILSERKKKNSQYSLTAFARDLDLSASLLSRILNGTRSLTLKQGMHIAALLGFNQNETNLFTLGIIETASPTAKISKKVREKIQHELTLAAEKADQDLASPLYVNYDVERFKAISQWYHIAILNLTYVKGFSANPVWIATQLGISSAEAKQAVERLTEFGFLEESANGKLKKSKAHFYFKTDRSETAVRTHQSQMIDKAQTELKKTADADFASRMINSITFPCAPKHVALLKKKIDEFQDEVLALIRTEKDAYQEVYQLNCQLFPLTKKTNLKKAGELK